ncbi:hypothetical protein BDK51DRAFT_36688 [Blyttiomyces helicus]|uniref:Uncharacterized protein n=1 Tax=Blyttiomyces helicus TaxID=388810 RepID=A0A4P9WE27_9FUNG|nr:hypothetical protein BDK51DRAFT_36688 [Blyttiomyces helicus]|eukprot:RKO90834.1 hypothetical protein BDK51DRAFT_36688 [Blyttiomyces helicus]
MRLGLRNFYDVPNWPIRSAFALFRSTPSAKMAPLDTSDPEAPYDCQAVTDEVTLTLPSSLRRLNIHGLLRVSHHIIAALRARGIEVFMASETTEARRFFWLREREPVYNWSVAGRLNLPVNMEDLPRTDVETLHWIEGIPVEEKAKDAAEGGEEDGFPNEENGGGAGGDESRILSSLGHPGEGSCEMGAGEQSRVVASGGVGSGRSCIRVAFVARRSPLELALTPFPSPFPKITFFFVKLGANITPRTHPARPQMPTSSRHPRPCSQPAPLLSLPLDILDPILELLLPLTHWSTARIHAPEFRQRALLRQVCKLLNNHILAACTSLDMPLEPSLRENVQLGAFPTDEHFLKRIDVSTAAPREPSLAHCPHQQSQCC